ncbi:MAG: FKBP-type peptidyl-prolyl cis-trans isomerase [Prolixibacteraceae bacterium]|jgi:FKBP-type peptidyl-prolyl cis-trans isomerase FklB|nr:FKBP-type peptidyl-prolyl cis-trans isomerase [Prolixibacteraceae bacterium]
MSFESQVEKFSYAIGLSLASNLLQSQIKTVDLPSLFEAITDVMEGKQPKISPQDANAVIEEHFKTQQASQGAVNAKEGEEFLAKNKSEEGIVVLESGLQYKVLTEGNGPKPKASDKVKCHYHGTLVNGTVFDSSVERGQPAEFPVNGVIGGWIEALQLMTTGSKWRLFIPAHLAYGDNGAGGAIGPKATLIFDVELLEIV